LAGIEPRRAKAERIRLLLEALRPHAEYTAAVDGAEISVTPVAEVGRAHLSQKAHTPLFWRLVCLGIIVAHYAALLPLLPLLPLDLPLLPLVAFA
jgi:hypothetical protein